MMFLNCFLALLLSYLAGDFVFQTDKLCELKKDKDIIKRAQWVSIHVAIIFLINIIVFKLVFIDIPWMVIFSVNSFHWVLDMVKSQIQSKIQTNESDSVITSKIITTLAEKTSIIEITSYESDQASTSKEVENEKATEKNSEKITSTHHMESKTKTRNWDKELFVADQILHLISIFIAAYVLYKFDISHYVSFCKQFVSGTVTVSKSLTFTKKLLLIAIYSCLATSVSNVVIKIFLGALKKNLGEDLKTGRNIGSIERILTISIILVGAWQALTVLYGSKTAIRFEKAKESPDFAEYYILGTTISALFAVIIALAVKITLF